ncbi:type I polyketide synthase [Sorangium sp. So ce1128]
MKRDDVDEQGSFIAVVGMACRFPGAADLDAFWTLLCDGVESLSFFPLEEKRGSREVRAYGMLEGADLFDAALFGYSPREASLIDPQQRVFLECAHEALEHAGYDPHGYPGAIGIFAGGATTAYWSTLKAQKDALALGDDWQFMIATGLDFLTTRAAYKLNLRGPAITVQTACSTSLVSIHLATQALLSGDCEMALAGGATVRVPAPIDNYTEGGVLSPDGHCRAFDARAQGTVGANGVGVVVLKPLADALRDGDHIHAVLRGSAVNNDSGDKMGFAAPSITGQARAIRTAHRVADVSPETITYVETHGTGTPLGDPVEIAALTQAFRAGTDRTGFCAIGSVKTNIGHTDAAAGVAGFIKAVLAIERGLIPPSLNFERPNPQIPFDQSPFVVNTALRPWRVAGDRPRRAGVNSLGVGGTNAHVVLEQAPAAEASGPARPAQLLVLSARTPTALAAMSARLGEHLHRHPEIPLADAAWTLQVGRRAYPFRRYAVCAAASDARRALGEPGGVPEEPEVDGSRPRPVTFLFPDDRGPVDVTGDLYRHEPEFRRRVDECFAWVRAHLRLDPAQVKGLSVFALEYALARLWSHWGVSPAAAFGQGAGAHVAACVSGRCSLADALSLLAEGELTARAAEPVEDALAGLLEGPEGVFLEVGVGTRLMTRVQEHPRRAGRHLAVATLPEGVETGSALASTLAAAGRLWQLGAPIHWARLHEGERRKRVVLPAYPFERKRYLVEAPPAQDLQRPVAGPPPEAQPVETPAGIRSRLQAGFAEVLGVSEVAVDDDFFDLGGDSIFVMDLTAWIERTLQVKVALDELYSAPTVARLAELVAERQRPAAAAEPPARAQEVSAPEGSRASRWLGCRRRRPGAAFRLYCFPHSGGAAGEYLHWGDHLEDVEVWGIQLPGRGGRMQEPSITRMSVLVETLLGEISWEAPFALFGHSLGGLMAYETAHALRAAGREMPGHLFVSACPPPHLLRPEAVLRSKMSDADLIASMTQRLGGIPDRLLGDGELLKRVLPAYRADFELFETYRPPAERPPLDCRLVSIRGDQDATTGPELEEWSRNTRARFEAHVLPGGHFYLREQQGELLRLMRRALELADGPGLRMAHGS